MKLYEMNILFNAMAYEGVGRWIHEDVGRGIYKYGYIDTSDDYKGV